MNCVSLFKTDAVNFSLTLHIPNGFNNGVFGNIFSTVISGSLQYNVDMYTCMYVLIWEVVEGYFWKDVCRTHLSPGSGSTSRSAGEQ